ncbi:Ig-like domain-containing protein [Fulvivirga sp. 29W222]|uniref:Ig-like domain-containing protein n=1 Tax=Fulvivirga marina TaxID=2494733 RepID=A0A937FWY4_9BACT|nr:Calx-beta domain-containing protein [Fulvivirga marina]MBL6445905.1 Ig-like domain-containing protein [Fulvivirga marina]
MKKALQNYIIVFLIFCSATLQAQTVNLSLSASSGTEASTTAITVTATASANVTGDQTVDVAISGTNITAGDYTLSGTTITIADGTSTGSVTFTIVDDAVYEGAETASISISNPSAGITLGTTTSADVAITDNEASPDVTLGLIGSPLAENGGVATVTATISPLSELDVTVDLIFSGASSPGDYTASATSIVITAGNASGSMTITGVDDALDESDESVIVDVDIVTNGTELTPQSVTALINDDDPPVEVTLGISGSPLAENGGVATVTATLAAVSGRVITVDLAFSGTATGGGTDYSVTGNSIVINPGVTSGSIDITGVDDSNVEGGENIIVDINTVNNGTESGTQQVSASITDDDAPSVAFGVTSGTVAAASVAANITLTFSEAMQKSGGSPLTDSDLAAMLTLKYDNASGTDIPFTATIDGGKTIVTINPADNNLGNNFFGSRNYYVAIAGNVIETQTASINLPADNTTITTALLSEPASYPTGFSITNITTTSIELTWTGATSNQLPEYYLIVAKKTSGGTFAGVSDGTPVADDFDFSGASANGAVTVLHQSGTNTYTWTGLDELTDYTFRIYPYTNYASDIDYKTNGTVPETSGTTDCTAPSGQASGITFSSINANSIQVDWTPSGTASGALVLVKEAATPIDPTNGNSYTANANIASAPDIESGGGRTWAVFQGAGSSVIVTGLKSSTTYHFAIYEYNSTNQCYNLTSPASGNKATTAADNSTTITNGSGVATISSLADTEAERVAAFTFTISDTGPDGQQTDISQMTFRAVGSSNEVADWTQAIAGAKLGDGDSNAYGVHAPAIISSNSIEIPNIEINFNNALGEVSDNSTKNYTLYIWLKPDMGGSLPVTIDGLHFAFSLSNVDIVTDANQSGMQPGTGAGTTTNSNTSGGTNNEVTVVATELQFISQPSNTFVLSSMTPAVTVQAADANSNRDLDYTGSVDLLSTGTLASTPSASFSAGLGTYNNIVHNPSGSGLQLSTTNSSPALSNATSTTFDITGPAAVSDIFANGSFTPPTDILYTNYQAADITTAATSLEIARFDIRDGGSTASDGDVFATELTDIEFTINNPTFIRSVALYADNNLDGNFDDEIAEAAPVGNTVTFSSLSVTAPSDGMITFALRVSFTTTVVDNTQVTFTVSSATANPASSNFGSANAGGATSSLTTGDNTIEVTATQLVFTTQPPALFRPNVNVTPQPQLEARDANSIMDLDYNSSITVTNTDGLTMVNTPTAFTNGSLTFPAGFQYTSFNNNQPNNGTLTVADGTIANAVSNDVFIDGQAPTVNITDDQSDNLVRNFDNVNITITFTENHNIDEAVPPVITIGSVVTNGTMEKVDNKTWTYFWNVPGAINETAPVTITATDEAGNSVSTTTGRTTYIIDNSPPIVTQINRLDPSPTNAASVSFEVIFNESVVNVDASDFVATLGTVGTITGSGTTYTVTVDNLTGLTGTLELTVPVAADIKDLAGNTYNSLYNSGESYIVDSAPPLFLTLSPADNSFNNPTGSKLVFKFNENVQVGSGFVRLYDASDALVQAFDISSLLFESQNQFTATPTLPLTQGTGYYIQMDPGVVNDFAGNAFAGISDKTSWNFTTFAPPQVTSISPFGCVGGTITISGTFLTGVTTVTFNGTGGSLNSPSIVTNSDTQLTVVVPSYSGAITSLSGTLDLSKDDGSAVGSNPEVTITTTQTVQIGPSEAVLSVGSINNSTVCTSGATQTSTIKVDIRGGAAPYDVVYSLGSTTGYTSGTDITIDPSVIGLNTYTLVSVTDANGCDVPTGQLTGSYNVTLNERPTVEAGGDASGQLTYCLDDGVDITLDAATLGTGPSFSANAGGIVWSTNGNGTFNTSTNLNAVYHVGTQDIFNNTVNLTITTTGNPTACSEATDVLTINFVSNATANPGGFGNVLDYCWDGSNPAQIQLNGSVSGNSTGYLWETVTGTSNTQFSDQTISNPVYTFSSTEQANQTAEVTLTPTGGTCGAGVTSNLVINLVPLPTNSFQPPVNNEVCLAQSSVPYKVSNNTGSTYSWTVPTAGGTSFVGQGTSTIIVDWGTASGNQSIEVVETDANGCQSNPIILPVTVNNKPVVTFTPQINHAQGETNKYRLALLEPPANTDTIPEGTLNVAPYIEFYSNDGGIIRENGKWYFDSKDLNLGSYVVEYIYVDNNGCSTTGSETFEVFDNSSLIGNLDPEYCEDEPQTATLTPFLNPTETLLSMHIRINTTGSQRYAGGTPEAEALGLISTSGTDLGPFVFAPGNAADSIPELASSIELELRYRYTTSLGSIQARSQKTTVYKAPTPLFSIEGNQRVYCSTDAEVQLTPNNDLASGTNTFNFTSDFDVNDGTNTVIQQGGNFFFYPGNFPMNVNTYVDSLFLVYTFDQNIGGSKFCSNSDTLKVDIFNQPTAPSVNGDMSPSVSACIIEASLPEIRAEGITGTVPGGVDFAWFETNGTDGTPIWTGPVLDQNIIAGVSTVDQFYVAQAFRGNNCFSPTVEVVVEKLDVFDFAVNTSCIESGSPITFTKNTTGINLESIRWKVNGSIESTQTAPGIVDDFGYPFTSPGLYAVALEIESQNGCINELSKNVVITPQKVASNADVYFQNFESNDGGGWVANGSNSSWEYGTPTNQDIVLGDNNGNIIWITGLDGSYNKNEQSYLYSPCFDISGIDRPMISFDSWTNTADKEDGVIIEYSVGGINGPWTRLGNFDDGIQSGINWYNQRDISSNPGNQSVGFYGWSGTNSGWINSKHQLDNIPVADRSNVIFRFTFKSTPGSAEVSKPDGFAIDNVFIGNRTRIVLVENFTNTAQTQNTKTEADYLKTFNLGGSTELVKINYHTAFPGDDPFNSTNTADPSARALYYNIAHTPRARLDGIIREDLGTLFSEWGDKEYGTRTLSNASFDISITSAVNGDALDVSVALKALVDIAPNSVVHIAVVEKSVDLAQTGLTNVASGEQNFEYVLRKMLPSASGTKISSSIAQGETININHSWIPQLDFYNPASVAIIAFIQDEDTREVYQSSIVDNFTLPDKVTGINNSPLEVSFRLFPNPANDKLTIILPVGLKQPTIKVFDMFGKVIFDNQATENRFDLDTKNMAAGMYHVQVETEDGYFERKRVLIIHN